MTVTKKETKTFYNVRISYEDFETLVREYDRVEKMQTLFPTAFKDLQSRDPDDMKKFFENWGFFRSNAQTYRYVARYYGFDGWYNCGYTEKGSIRMVLYNEGADEI